MQTARIDLSNTYTYLCFLFVLSDKEAYWLSKALNKQSASQCYIKSVSTATTTLH